MYCFEFTLMLGELTFYDGGSHGTAIDERRPILPGFDAERAIRVKAGAAQNSAASN